MLTNSEAAYKQSVVITTSRRTSKDEQNMKEGMTLLHDSKSKLRQDISQFGNITVEMQSNFSKFGDAASSEMNILHHKSEVGNVTEATLHKLNELLAAQSAAVEGLCKLNDFMISAKLAAVEDI